MIEPDLENLKKALQDTYDSSSN